MYNVLLPPGVNPIAVNKYSLSKLEQVDRAVTHWTCVVGVPGLISAETQTMLTAVFNGFAQPLPIPGEYFD
jgi:hypothetical protein